jgi:hypothetical protein
MSRQNNISYESKSSNLNTLDRELSLRSTNSSPINSQSTKSQSTKSQSTNLSSTNLSSTNSLSTKPSFENYSSIISPLVNSSSNQKAESNKISQKNDNIEKKIKYVSTNKQNFREFFSFGKKLGQNYNTDEESNLRFSETTRRNSLSANEKKIYKNKSRDESLDNITNNKSSNPIINMISVDSDLRMNINSNIVSNIAAKIPKESSEYWDNTKKHNLNTAVYTNNPTKIQGRGFGDIDKYDLFLNGIGTSTRQDNPDINPRNLDNDRVFLTNHNYNYDKLHVPEKLGCGTDTRYLNKKMV